MNTGSQPTLVNEGLCNRDRPGRGTRQERPQLIKHSHKVHTHFKTKRNLKGANPPCILMRKLRPRRGGQHYINSMWWHRTGTWVFGPPDQWLLPPLTHHTRSFGICPVPTSQYQSPTMIPCTSLDPLARQQFSFLSTFAQMFPVPHKGQQSSYPSSLSPFLRWPSLPT